MATIVDDTTVDTLTPAGTSDSSAAQKAWSIVSFIARFGMAAVWLIAGGIKYGKDMENILSVQSYQLLPDNIAFIIGTWLPTVEIAIGVLLLIGLFLRPAGVLSAVLQVIFIAGMPRPGRAVCRLTAVASAPGVWIRR